MKNIRVLLVDDHALVREGIRALLQLQGDIEVAGEAGDGREAIEKTRELTPDVIVMDISMPSMGGIEATRQILQENPTARIVVLSRHDDLSYARSLLKVGASGYIPKKAVSTDLAAAIRAVSAGDMFLHPSVAKAVARDYVQLVQFEDKSEPYERLTDREKEILKLLVEGSSSRKIAERLCLAMKTVLNHRRNIMEKLGIENPAQLIKYAIKLGLVEDDI
ncbi:MAG: response regulator transcription factor [Dehalococcoidales bacterium]|nr:response regulator transcription factor [Dehalococcoidales bacterium]